MTSYQTVCRLTIALSVIVSLSCKNDLPSKKAPEPRTVVVCEPVNPAAADEVTFRPGDSLAAISQRRYGSQHYHSVILLYNKLEEERAIPPDTRIRTPDLRQALVEEIREVAYQPAMEWIVCAQVKYRKQESQLEQLANSSRQNHVEMPGDVAQALMDASEDLNAAIANLAQPTNADQAVPSRSIGQLREATGLHTTLAKGEFDGYGYDRDMVNQRLALAMTYLILWARSGYK